MAWPIITGRWSVYEASPGTQSGGAWTALTDQTGGGDDILPVSGAVPVIGGYAPGGTTEVAEIGSSDVFRAGHTSGWGAFGVGGSVFCKAAWDEDFDNQSSRFSLRTGGYGTGGSVSTLLTLRHGVGDVAQLHLETAFSGPGFFGPVFENIPLAGTGNKAHWIQYAIRWLADGSNLTWTVIIVGDRGAGVQTFANTSFVTSGMSSTLLNRAVTAMQMGAPRGGSLGFWYGVIPDADFEDAVIADGEELGADLAPIFVPDTYACECAEIDAGFRVVLDFGGLTEEFEGVEGVISETLDFFEIYTGDRSMPIAVIPVVMDVPALIAAGHSLEDATVRVYHGEDLVMVGRPERPLWGRRGEAIRFTVREDPWEDRTVFPAGWDQRVTVQDPAAIAAFEAAGLAGIPISQAYGYGPQIGSDDRYRVDVPPYVSALGLELFVEQVEGRAGPVVFGAPGYQDGETWGATPAYWIVTTEGDEQLMIARHRVAATAVTIFGRCVDGQVRGKVCPVSHVLTPAGITVAVAEITAGVAVRPRLQIVATFSASATYNVTLDLTYIPGLLPGAAGVTTPRSLDWGGGATYDDMRDALALELQNTFPQAVSVEQTADADPVATFVVVLPIAYDLDITAQSATGGSSAVVATTTNTGVTLAGNEDFDVDFTAEWSVGWHAGEGLPGGAGDVIAYVLNQTGIRLDRGRLESHRSHLNGYQLAGYIDEQVVAIEWLAAQLRALPISWVAGREGLFAWLYDPEALAVPVATLTEDETISIDGDAGLTSRAPVRRVELAYRSRADVADTSLVTSQETLYSRLSSGVVEALSTDVIDATATAERAAALRQRALSRRLPVIGGTVARDLDWLRVGDPVQFSAPSWGLSGVALVTGVDDAAGARVRVALTVLS